KARLVPPLERLRPGGYEFARDLYFHGVGATGFVLGSVTVAQAPVPREWTLRYASVIGAMHSAIDNNIRESLSGDQSAIASALLTGTRDSISGAVNDALYVAGLGHVLSISGYHMAVVAGIVFFFVRGVLALIPYFANHHPIKKWAALIA